MMNHGSSALIQAVTVVVVPNVLRMALAAVQKVAPGAVGGLWDDCGRRVRPRPVNTSTAPDRDKCVSETDTFGREWRVWSYSGLAWPVVFYVFLSLFMN